MSKEDVPIGKQDVYPDPYEQFNKKKRPETE
jgi:hypothetical protein